VFYVWISVFNLFVVSVFWTLMVDRSTGEQAKRLFGFIAAGGTLGGFLGPIITDLLIAPLGMTGILVISASLFGIAVLCQVFLLRSWRRPTPDGASDAAALSRPIGGNPFAGFVQVIRSPYLMLFCVFILLLSATTTFLYFEQLRLVREAFPDEVDRTRVFARLDYVVQGLSILTQLFLTSRIATRLGVGVLLVSIPIAMVGGFLALAVQANFWIIAVVMVVRRAGEYAVTRPGREILFTAVDTETKYKAKNFIDVPVYRGGDWISAAGRGLLRASELSATAIALVGAAIAAAWAVTGVMLARGYETRANPQRQTMPGAVAARSE
jgi:AAA family ATP:ADP antiporter